MKNTTTVEVRGVNDAPIQSIIGPLGVTILSSKLASRPGWIAYELKRITEKYKIAPVPGYTFMGVSYSEGKRSKWRAAHPQTFPSTLYRPILLSTSLTTEDWYDITRGLLEQGAEAVKINRRQFSYRAVFEKFCDELGVWRIIPAERGLNK